MPRNIEDIPVEKIHVSFRYRLDEGDLESLAASINEIGLLQPIGIDQYYTLIFGSRRLKACRDILGWQTIPCAVLKIDSLLGEYSENEFRKQFTPSERAAIGRAVEEELGNRKPGPKSGSNDPQLGRTADIAARKAGFTDRQTYERAKTVVDRGVPELKAAMDKGDVSISAAAAIASQPKPDQSRIVQMPKDERQQAVAQIRKSKADREKDERRARDLRVYSELYDSVQFLSRFYEEPREAWAGIGGVNGFDFAELLHRAIQCLVRLERGNPNDRRPELVEKVL